MHLAAHSSLAQGLDVMYKEATEAGEVYQSSLGKPSRPQAENSEH